MVYPEGTRNLKPQSLPLKRGMLRYAYTERTPVQVVITTNKENILSEKMRKATFGVTCVVGYSDVVRPADHGDFESFFEAVQATWEAQWEKTCVPQRSAAEHCVFPTLSLPLSLSLALSLGERPLDDQGRSERHARMMGKGIAMEPDLEKRSLWWC